ncbi:MAG: GAF domain-containing protein [Anaerolineae bacterium]|nr:GAF domain-containing protein [Anaerolineae bacterium]
MSDDRLTGFIDDVFSGLAPPEPEGEEPPPADADGAATARGKKPTAPSAAPPREGIETWRARFVETVLTILAIVGLPLTLVGSYQVYTTGSLWIIPLYLLAYLILVLITFWKRSTYPIQAIGLLALVYGLGTLDLMTSGRGGDGRVFLLAFPPLAVLLFDRRGGWIALGLSLVTIALFAGLFCGGVIQIPPGREATSTNVISWISNSAVFSVLSILLLLSLGSLVPRLATALEETTELAQQLTRHQVDLETQRARLEERTRALQDANYAIQRRAIQLEASAEVGRAIASIFDVDQLLHRSVDLICDRFGFYHAAIYLLDKSGEGLVLREATGDAGLEMKAQGYRLPVDESSMVGWTAARRQSRLALNTEKDLAPFQHAPLPHTRSEVTLPLVVGGRLMGVLDVQSNYEAAFDSDDVRTLQSMADQIGVAIDNARRFTEEAALLEATSPIYRASRRMTTATSIDDVLDIITATVTETDINGYVVGIFEPLGGAEPEYIHLIRSWRRERLPTIEAGTRTSVAQDPSLVQAYAHAWVAPNLEESKDVPEISRPFLEQAGVNAVANFPVRVGSFQAGFFFVWRDTPGPFSESDLRLYETLADQAAVALERARLLNVTRKQAEEEAALRAISDRVARAMDVESVLQGAINELSQILRAKGAYVKLGVDLSLEEGEETL